MRTLVNRVKQFFLIFGAVSCISPTINAFNLPELGNSNEAVLTVSKEKRLGLALYQQICSHVDVLDDPLLAEYIQSLGDRLLGNANRQPFRFHFFFIHHNAVNAFAGPGGYVAIHTGLVNAVKDEAELASVMTHEISHATQRHISRGLERTKVSKLANIGAMIAAAAVGMATKNGDAATGALLSAQAFNVEQQLGYSRTQEQEADRLGINLLYSSGYNPKATPDFLETLDRISSIDRSIVSELLSTHPLTGTRIADMQNRARQFPPKAYRNNNDRFELMRARLLVEISRHPDKLRRALEQKLSKHPELTVPLTYGHALASMKMRDHDTAVREMTALHQQQPNQLIFSMGLAEVYDQQRQYQKALTYLEDCYPWAPDYAPLVYQYADTLLAAKHSQRAQDLLNRYAEQHTLPTPMLRLQAKTCAALKQLAKAYLYNAQADLAEGQYRSAYRLAKQGLKQPHLAQSTELALKKVMKESEALNVPIQL